MLDDEMISPERFNRSGAWRFTKWLYRDKSIEQDSFFVTRVMEAVAQLFEDNQFVCKCLILRFGLFDGANYTVDQVVQIFDCAVERVMNWIVAGIEYLSQALNIELPYPKSA